MKILKYFLWASFFLFPAITVAATYIVDKTGGGDFTTIQAAVSQAASDESMGPPRAYANFTHGSNIVSIPDGTSALETGMLITVDDRNWYKITQIIDSTNLRIERSYDGNNVSNNYKVVNIAIINIRPGIYHESVNMQGLHFVRIEGLGVTRESTTIQPAEVLDPEVTSGFNNIEGYGHVHFKKLTVRNISPGAIITTGDDDAEIAPSDTNLRLEDVHFDAQCCDVIYSSYGHVAILNSRLEGQNDILGGFYKSLTITKSELMSLRTSARFGYAKAVFVKLLYNSSILNSLLFAKSQPINVFDANGVGFAAVINGTNGSTLTIRNSVLSSDSTQAATAIQVNSASTVYIEGSRLLARSKEVASDIKMSAAENVTLKCTEYATVSGSGLPTVLPCP